MSQPASAGSQRSVAQALSADLAMRIAWRTWFALLSVPFALFVITVWRMMLGGVSPAESPLARTWFIVTMIYLAIAVPSAMFRRSHLFKGYWSGRAVQPREYLLGMITIWLALFIGGLMAVMGCLVTRTLVPNVLPALLAFMLFAALWPNGHAMLRAPTDEQDPASYEEPR